MPQAVIAAPAFWGAIAGAGATLGAGALASHGAGQAADAQERANAAALEFEKQKEAERIKEAARVEAEKKAAWEAHEALLAPYRQMSASILQGYGFKGGLPAPAAMPPGWAPGAPTGQDHLSRAPVVPVGDTSYVGGARPDALGQAPMIPDGPQNLEDLTRSYFGGR